MASKLIYVRAQIKWASASRWVITYDRLCIRAFIG
jgi:hypothetical protein